MPLERVTIEMSKGLADAILNLDTDAFGGQCVQCGLYITWDEWMAFDYERYRLDPSTHVLCGVNCKAEYVDTRPRGREGDCDA